MGILNLNYIGVIYLKDGRYTYVKETIYLPTKLIAQLEDISRDSGTTTVDMYELVAEFLNGENDKFNYCLPEEMTLSYIPLTVLPRTTTDSKIDYLFHLKKYIYALCYNRTYKTIIRKENVVYVTHSEAGYKSSYFSADRILEVEIHSNFGSGPKSSISANIKYKDKRILLCSKFLEEIYREHNNSLNHTLEASATPESVEKILKDVCIIGNDYLQGEDTFEKKYFCDEVRLMGMRLKEVNANPLVILESYLNRHADHSGVPSYLPGRIVSLYEYNQKLISKYFKYWALIRSVSLIHYIRASNILNELIVKQVDETSQYIKTAVFDSLPDLYNEIEKLKTRIHNQESIEFKEMLIDILNELEAYESELRHWIKQFSLEF